MENDSGEVMSFKRDSDNKSFHEQIRKRRVNELLCDDIPEDEATLMKNGRFACLVCAHRPIFDTLDMLSLHRSSKKHKHHNETFTANKHELEDLKRKRYAEQYVETGHVPGESEEPSSQHKLLNHPVYNACTKRPKLKPHERKSRLNLDTEQASTSKDSQTSNQKQSKPRAKIYHRPLDVDSLKEKLFKKATKKSESKSVAEEAKETKQFVNIKMNRLMNQGKGKKSDVVIGPQAMPSPAPEKMEYVKKYLTAIGSGWKKDRGGQWVKDEDAEFDSDEEEPDVPLPSKHTEDA